MGDAADDLTDGSIAHLAMHQSGRCGEVGPCPYCEDEMYTAPISFYRASGAFGYLSNLWPAPLTFEGVAYPDSERAYQAGKPVKPEVAAWLAAAPTASLCAQAAHALLPWQVRPDWNAAKVGRMRDVLRAKFAQHPDLAAKLLATGGAALVEESKSDAFWGTGKKGTGKNMLGVLLMEVRDELRAQAAPDAKSKST